MICYDALSAAEVIYRRLMCGKITVNDLGGGAWREASF